MVPPTWKHPKNSRGKHSPLFDSMTPEEFEAQVQKWNEDDKLWSEGHHPDQLKYLVRSDIKVPKHFKDWDPEADAIRIAADLLNGVGDGIVSSMAKGFGWPPRRMNPAVNYLVERRLVDFGNEIGTHPWCRRWISKNHATRRFLRDRS